MLLEESSNTRSMESGAEPKGTRTKDRSVYPFCSFFETDLYAQNAQNKQAFAAGAVGNGSRDKKEEHLTKPPEVGRDEGEIPTPDVAGRERPKHAKRTQEGHPRQRRQGILVFGVL